jgi:hypothetical protein
MKNTNASLGDNSGTDLYQEGLMLFFPGLKALLNPIET